MAFINSRREILLGDNYFKSHVMPESFDWRKNHKVLSPYYAQYGFSVSMMYNDFYSYYSGIESDRYASMDLIFFYILPSLIRNNMIPAYRDKNLFLDILHGVPQPKTVIGNRNGIFFGGDGKHISKSEAIIRCLEYPSECIIKPSINTSEGRGVDLLDKRSAEVIFSSFERYGEDFIVQERTSCHPLMSLLNPTSVNTIRMFTYRDFDKNVHFLEEVSHLRIGVPGAVKDNIGNGGGAVKVLSDGRVEDTIFKYKRWEKGSLKETFGLTNFKVPSFEKAVQLICDAHERLPYFDVIGWDVAILDDGSPCLIEFNIPASIEIPTMIGGPFLGKYLDEIMDRVRHVRKIQVGYDVNLFKSGFEHITQFSGQECLLGRE